MMKMDGKEGKCRCKYDEIAMNCCRISTKENRGRHRPTERSHSLGVMPIEPNDRKDQIQHNADSVGIDISSSNIPYVGRYKTLGCSTN